jgi:hypothetical protein
MAVGSSLERLMAVYKGQEGVGVAFQPRIKHWYDVNLAAGTMPERYQGMYLDEVYRDLMVIPREVWVPGGGYLGLKVKEGNNVEVWSMQMENTVITEYRTPKGSIRQIERVTEHGTSKYNLEYFLKEVKDIEVYKYILQERKYEWDQRSYEWGKKRFGNIIPLRVNLQRSPLMWLNVGLMGFQRTVIMLWKHQKEMEELLYLLEAEFHKMLEVCKGKPIVEVHFGDNMHQDMCPPPFFKKYVIPFYRRIVEKVHEMGMYSTSHWDGFVKQLLPLVRETGLDGLECVTPQPQGDVTIEEMKKNMGDMFLRDGIPAVLFCPWVSLDTLEAHVRKLLQTFYPRIILGISDLLPANADVERVRFVNKIVDEFNESIK